MTDMIDLPTDAIVKAINDDYSVILQSERANLPKALALAEKLNVLRTRARRGEWKKKFSIWGLNISYETASVYLRIWENWPDILQLAAEKSVDPTLLTIDKARELWAKRKEDDDDADDTATDDDEKSDDDDGGGQSDETEEETIGKDWLRTLAPDDLITWLKEVHDIEWLRELAAKLAKELTPLPPRPTADTGGIPPNLLRTPTTTPPTTVGAPTVGIRRV
jgi:hypothetical protein